MDVQTFRRQTIWAAHIWEMGRTFGRHHLDVWATHDMRMCCKAWRWMGHIHSGQHFAGDDNSLQYLTLCLCHMIASCIPKSRV